MDIFERINLNSPLDTEEMRYDMPITRPLSVAYVGLAPDNSDTTAEAWNVVKIEYDGNGQETRRRLFQNVAWDSRAELGI